MEVKIYTTPTCGYCHQAKEFLDGLGVNYTEYDVSRDRAAAQQVREWAGGTEITPIFDVKGTIVVDFDRTTLGQVLGVA